MVEFSSMISLKDRYILVTGACGLLGTEISKAIADFGGNVIVSDLNETSCIEHADMLSKKYKVDARPIVLDINSEQSVESVIDYAQKNSLEISGLVNNAYPRNKTYGTRFEDIELDSWKENVDIHLNGYFNVTQKISRVMMKQKNGSIVNMASIYGFLGPDFSIYEGTKMTMPAEYATIKGGIVNLTRYLATYLASSNIRVNCVSPGGIYDNQPEEFVNNYSKKVPMRRMGKPEDVAGGVVFLLSGLAGYITGHNLVIDGGWSAW